MPKAIGLKPPGGSDDLSFAELLKYALKIGLGRSASSEPNRIEWLYADIVTETDISERTIRNYRNGTQIPSTTHLKRLFSVLLSGEMYKAEWELAFIQAWARVALDVEISPDIGPSLPQHVGHTIKVSDMSVSDTDIRKKFVGAVVTWSNINRGTYAPRPHLLNAASFQFDLWIESTQATISNGRCPIFWIDGRSGDGKSVLLLQLAWQIAQNHIFSNAVYANSGDNLPEVIEYLNRRCPKEGIALVIVDDIHKISDIDKFRTSMRSLLDVQPFHVVILTCGPTPEKDEFESRNSFFEITSWPIPELTTNDLEIFGDWFGVSFDEILISSRMILVELLFELSVGEPIESFAESFRARLRLFDVFEATKTMLAVNSLDMSAPDCVFRTNQQKQSINRLAADDQLHFETIAEPWGDGVRLVHNQIANRILGFWLRDSLRRTSEFEGFANEISEVLSLDCVDGQFAYYLTTTISKRLRLVFEGKIDDDPPNLARFFDFLISNSGGSPKAQGYAVQAALAFWIGGVLDRCDDYTIDVAKAVLQSDEIPNGTKAGVFSNLVILEQKGLIRETFCSDNIENFLFGEAGSDYGNALIHLARFKIVSPDTIGRWFSSFPSAKIPPELFSFSGHNEIIVNAAIMWVKKNPASLQAGKTLASLLKSNPSSHEVRDCSLDWIAEGMTRPGSSNVVAMLLNLYMSDKIVKEIAFRWVLRNPDRKDLHQILSILLNNYANEDKTKRIVINWVNMQKGSPSASNIVAVVVKKYARDPEILELARKWIVENVSVPGVDGVAAGLVSVLHGQSKFFSLGYQKLRRRIVASLLYWYYSDFNLDSKPHLAAAVLKKFPNLRGIRERALHELARMRENPGIHVVLSVMLNTFKRDQAVRLEIIDWIENNNDHNGMPNVLCALLDYEFEISDNQNIALDWCERNPDHGGVQQVIASLLGVTSKNKRVKLMLHRLFDDNLHRDVEPTLISPILRAYPGNAVLIEKIVAWCRRNVETRGVHLAFSVIVMHLGDNEDILSFIVDWAEKNYNSPGVDKVLSSLIKNKSAQNTAKDLAISWIDTNLESTGWAILAAVLLENFSNDKDIISQCFSWLKESPNARKSKALVFKMNDLGIRK